MKWYLAKLVFKIICGEGNHTAQFDEQIRLINAESSEQAIQLAKEIGEEESENFLHENQRLVKWNFLGIAELIILQPEYHGAEVYSRIIETSFEEGYLKLFSSLSEKLYSNVYTENSQI